MSSSLENIRRRAYYRLFGGDAVLARVLQPGFSVLDVGCSDGRGSELLTGADGCDIYRPALETARRVGRRRRPVQGDLRHLPYRDRSYDLVVALDVVEHFEKPDALAVIAEMERVARQTVVVMTPSGFVPQPPGENEPWQEHRCGFAASELTALGFRVEGVGGPAALRGPYGSFRGGVVGQTLAVASSPYIRRRPEHAFHVVAVKTCGPVTDQSRRTRPASRGSEGEAGRRGLWTRLRSCRPGE